MSLGSLLAREDVLPLLTEPELVHVALELRKGPHVTPELYAWWGGRLWFATARGTLKGRSIGTGDRVGVLASWGDSSLVMIGEARPLDPLRPLTFASSPWEASLSGAAGALFLRRNWRHLAGFVVRATDALPRSPLQLPDAVRMMTAVRPVAAALVEAGVVVAAEGAWADGDLEPVSPARSTDETPSAEVGDAAVVGVSTASGPLALPAGWDASTGQPTIPAQILALAGTPSETSASIEVDDMDGFAMDGKRGVLVRGVARLTRRGPRARVDLTPERSVAWQGMRTESTSFEDPGPGPS